MAARRQARLHGRDAELAALLETVSAVRAGTPRSVVVEGEAGIGKTRLVHEAVGGSQPDDLVIWASGVALTGEQFSFGIVAQMLRSVVRALDDDTVSGFPPPARVLLDSVNAGSRAIPLQRLSRIEVFEGVTAMVDALSEDRLVWLAVDDVQWVDESSLDVLAYLTRALEGAQLLLTLTLRVGDGRPPAALSRFVAELKRLAGCLTIVLDPLDQAGTHAQLADLADIPPGPELVQRVLKLGEGNPFLTEELVRGGLGDRSSVPGSVQELMLERVHRLPQDAGHLVQTAAVAQGPVDHALLMQVLDIDGVRLDRALGEATSHHVLERDAGADGYRFHHALMKEAVVDDLLPGKAMALHRRWAEVIEATTSGRESFGADVAAAYHWSRSDDLARGLTTSLAAARVESVFHRPSERAPLLAQALGLWDRVPEADRPADRRRDSLALSAIGTWQIAGDWERAIELIEVELARRDEHDDPVRRMTLELFRAGALAQLNRGNGVPEWFRPEEAASLMLAAPDGPWLPDGCIAVGVRATTSDMAVRLYKRAITAADRQGVAVPHHQAAQNIADIELANGDLDAAMAIVSELMQFAASRLPEALSDVEAQLSGFQAATGKAVLALQTADEAARRLPPAQVSPRLTAYVTQNRIHALIELGRWDEAATLLDEAHDVYPTGWTAFELDLEAIRLAAYRGDSDQAQRVMESVWHNARDAEPDDLGFGRLGRARVAEVCVAAYRGDFDVVRHAAMSLWSRSDLEDASNHLWRPLLEAAAVEADHEHRRRRRARAEMDDDSEHHLTLIREVGGRLHRFGPLGVAWSAQLAAELQRWVGVSEVELWHEAVEAWSGTDHVHDRAWAVLRFAESHATGGDRETARRCVGEVLEVARRLRAVPLLTASEDLARQARLGVDVPSSGPGSLAERRSVLTALTEREAEVLRLLGDGMSNDQIARQLFISPKTASVHVSRILAKLGVQSRGEAGAVAFREGLMSDR